MNRRKPNMDAVVYSVPEIAALLGVNLTGAYALTKKESFPAIHVGKRILVPKTAFEKWLEQAGTA